MRVLSVRQPWAHALIHFGKNVENRSWTVPYRGDVAIHASSTPDPAGIEWARATYGLTLDALPRGVILGVVSLDEITTESPSPWARPGQQHWLVSNPRALDSPIPYTGGLRLRQLDDGAITLIKERLLLVSDACPPRVTR